MKTKSLLAILLLLSTACKESGKDGAQGPRGPAGEPGVPPTWSSRPATNIECASGGVVITIQETDNTMCNGSDGQDGNDGQDGQDGTIITPIKLCPETTTYPSVFVEYALCINNSLYAVYSTHGGFLAYLPPGLYSSNAVGSACNFTVSSGCVVQ